jgi:Rrf2 family protein
MRITTQAEYGLLCTLHLARRPRGVTVSAREVAEAEGLPAQYCEKIFRQLRRARIVESVRGAAGGFRLVGGPETISVKDVIDATEGRTFQVNCSDHPVHPERCQSHVTCSLRPIWIALQSRIDGLLGQIHLSDLLLEETQVRELVDRRDGDRGQALGAGAAPMPAGLEAAGNVQVVEIS